MYEYEQTDEDQQDQQDQLDDGAGRVLGGGGGERTEGRGRQIGRQKIRAVLEGLRGRQVLLRFCQELGG